MRERWRRAGEAATLLLSRYSGGSPLEQVVAHGGRALALVADGQLESASGQVEKGLTVAEQHRLDAAGRLPVDVARLYFALGEIRRIRAERTGFSPMPADFVAQLERRCQLLLDAQSAYSDAMRAYDPHWSAMAGYRVGESYQKLHQELMEVPPPASATGEDSRALFEGAMRLRYAILLQKALAMMTHTVAMAGRAGVSSVWVERARRAKGAIERAIREEQAAIDRLPFSRDQLQSALDRLAEKNREKDR
jgi:hypothetical protein